MLKITNLSKKFKKRMILDDINRYFLRRYVAF